MPDGSLTKEKVNSQWWVYMVQTDSGKLYTGITTDVDRRFKEHCSVRDVDGKVVRASKGAKFFRSDSANKVVFTECCDGRSSASRREAEIKKFPREKKLQLIVCD